MKVLIQGIEGCFHDAAAREFFAARFPGTAIQVAQCDTFGQMMERLARDPSLLAIMAVENTIAGALLPNMELLRCACPDCHVIGEHKMRISHVLCALPGHTIDSVAEVNSHPMALMQCQEFLHQYPHIKSVEKFDTAGAAREIAQLRLDAHAAVCGEYAANLYGLEILRKGIETNKRNFTRFLILARGDNARALAPDPRLANKASLVFTLPHSQGSLAKILVILSIYGINLTNIQSIPIPGHEWEYRFYIDLTFEDYNRYRLAIDAVLPCISDLRILGEYRHFETDNPTSL